MLNKSKGKRNYPHHIPSFFLARKQMPRLQARGTQFLKNSR